MTKLDMVNKYSREKKGQVCDKYVLDDQGYMASLTGWSEGLSSSAGYIAIRAGKYVSSVVRAS